MSEKDIICEISDIINAAVKDFGYYVCGIPGKIKGDPNPLLYSLSIHPDVDVNEHSNNGHEDKAKQAVEEAIPKLQYKGHKIEVSYGGKMWSGLLTIEIPNDKG